MEIDKRKAKLKMERAEKIVNRFSKRPWIRSAFLARFVLGVIGAFMAAVGVFMIYIQAVEHTAGLIVLIALWISAVITFAVSILASDKAVRAFVDNFFNHL